MCPTKTRGVLVSALATSTSHSAPLSDDRRAPEVADAAYCESCLNRSSPIAYTPPMSDLRNSIQGLAETFAAGVLQAIRSASLADILAESPATKRGPGRPPSTRAPGRPAAASTSTRLARRSATDIAAVTDSIVALVKKHAKGLRAEQIRAELGIAKKEWARPLEAALASKKLTKKGEKRATTYFAK